MRDFLISSSVLILGCCLIRRVSMGRISMRHIYSLWMLAAIGLCIIPFQIVSSPLSVLNVVDAVEERWEQGGKEETKSGSGMYAEEGETADREEGGKAAEEQLSETGKRLEMEGSIPAADFDFKNEIWRKPLKDNRNFVFWGIWAAGALIMAGWMLLVNIRLKREILQKRVPPGKKSSKKLEEAWMKLPIYLVDDLDSPCLLCVKGEKGIYIPDRLLLEPESMRHAAAHEICHYRQRDLVWNRLRSVFLAVYWFHPLVWMGAWLSRQDCELSCDEAAVNLLGPQERFAYGRTLLSLVGDTGRPRGLVYEGTWMTAGARWMKGRISRLARGTRMTFAGVCIYYLLVNLLVAAACFGPAADASLKEPIKEMDVSRLTVQDIRPLGSGNKEEENAQIAAQLAGFLSEHHILYIGDAVGSGRIIGACIRSAGIAGQASTELETSEEPFAYRLVYREEDKGALDEERIKAVSILAFASIDNMGLLEIYTSPDGIQKGEQLFKVSRQEAMELYGLTDLKVYGQSGEEMLKLVQMVEERF